jgi:ATP-dependent helicase HepA
MAHGLSKGQRWISEAEPELGLGIVLGADSRHVDILFRTRNVTRRYAQSTAPLRRVTFRVGDRIQDLAGASLQVTAIGEPTDEGLARYLCGNVSIIEDAIADTVSVSSPLQRFSSGIVDKTADFDLRFQTLDLRARMLRSPVRGFAGGRIELLPHQLFIAAEVSSRRVTRALLADETGLGKTIEACLILHRLVLTGRISRVLVLVPDHLVHQWFVELLRRFNLSFRLFTKEYCAAFAGNANPFLSDQMGICSVDFLSADPELSALSAEAQWDLVVVDEAHHLQQGSPAHGLVQDLSAKADGLLLLTATPEQLGRHDHFVRMQLLDPDRYRSYEEYVLENDALKKLWDQVEKTVENQRIDLSRTSPDAVAVPDDVLRSAGGSLPAPASGDRSRSCAPMTLDQLIDFYGTGRAMFRNTRQVIKGFPRRHVHITPLVGGPKTLEHLRDEFNSDTARDPGAKVVIPAGDSRITWLLQLTKELEPEKILVICTTRGKAVGIQRAMQNAVKIDIALFHEDMTLIQRDRNAAWFADEHGVRMLISSEIGSEGRNFQFCQHLVLFDLPMGSELVEQRIGRLDRIGQRPDIHIHVPCVKGSPQEALCRWYQEGLDIFSRNVPAAGRVFESLKNEFLQLCAAGKHGGGLEDLLVRSRAMRDDLTDREIGARDRLLEMSSFQPKKSDALISAIRAVDQEGLAEAVMTRLFEHYGVVTEDAGSGKTALITEYVTDHSFPLPRGERPVVTYDRKTALAREDIEFLTIDHPIVSGALDLFLSSDHGSTAFVTWDDANVKEILLESMFVVECISPVRLNSNRFLPPTTVRTVVNQQGKDLTESRTTEQLRQHGRNGPVARLLTNQSIMESVLPRMQARCEEIASARAKQVVEDAVAAMHGLLDGEMARLKFLESRNPATVSEEIQRCSREVAELEKYLRSSRLRLDAIRLVWRGPSAGTSETQETPQRPRQDHAMSSKKRPLQRTP